jgi:type IV pilus assembly protein PilV
LKTHIIRQDGVVIIENLVALLIFSMGILGIVGLLATSVKNTTDAKYRNDASLLANRIISQMWLDNKSNAALKTNYASPSGASYIAWKDSVADSLPDVSANPPTITIDTNNVVTVTIFWKMPSDPDKHRYVVTTQING